MILNNMNRRRTLQGALGQRRAFTLLEVLVVVAILVVLASVSSIYVFRYLEDAKIDKARLQAKNIEKAAKAYVLKYSVDSLTLQHLIAPPDGGKPFLEGGTDALNTGFGGQFVLDLGQVSDTGNEQNIMVQFKGPDGHTYFSNGKVQ